MARGYWLPCRETQRTIGQRLGDLAYIRPKPTPNVRHGLTKRFTILRFACLSAVFGPLLNRNFLAPFCFNLSSYFFSGSPTQSGSTEIWIGKLRCMMPSTNVKLPFKDHVCSFQHSSIISFDRFDYNTWERSMNTGLIPWNEVFWGRNRSLVHKGVNILPLGGPLVYTGIILNVPPIFENHSN